MVDSESLHRTVKLDMDNGRAATYQEAEALAREFVLQIVVGPAVATSSSLQAAVLTAVAVSAGRSFLGGVVVVVPDAVVRLPLYRGRSLRDVVVELGAELAVETDPLLDTVVMGTEHLPDATARCLYLSADRWMAKVSPEPVPWPEEVQPLAAILAAALGVSELFQARRGDVWAARRSLAVSLWAPGDCGEAANGPMAYALPTKIWLVGLGHLGQAYAWVLGLLPYPDPAQVEVTLQDVEDVSVANLSTGLFSTKATVGRRKTRVVAGVLESAGVRTRLIERALDEATRPQPDEATWVLGGLDAIPPRRALVDAGFQRYVDAGIGDDEESYLDIVVQTFPSEQSAMEAFPPPRPRRNPSLTPAYAALVEDQISQGARRGDAECGVLTLADEAVGVAFVGAVAATFVIADLLRHLNGSSLELATLGIDLRRPDRPMIGPTLRTRPPNNPGFVWVEPGERTLEAGQDESH